MYWNCRIRTNAEAVRGDIESRILQWDVAMLKASYEKPHDATAGWSKANPNEKGHLFFEGSS